MTRDDQQSAGKRAFGERIRNLRNERQWSQDDLATEAYLSQPEISKIENAHYSREPDRDTICKLAQAFRMQPVDLTSGTPFSAFFAKSEILTVGTRTDGQPVMVYFASALTNLDEGQQIEVQQLDEKVQNICQKYEPYPLVLYRPRLYTSPTEHADVSARAVYDIDRQSVADSDLLILAGIFPSLGAGMELQLALHSCSSVILLIKQNQTLSRMVTGCPARKRIVRYEGLQDLETRLPESLDALVPHLVDCRRGFAVATGVGIGSRVQQSREHRRLSQKDLARLVGVGTRYIQDLETLPEHISNPSLLVLRRIARVLNLTEGFLITGYDTPIQLHSAAFAEHLSVLDDYASEVQMPATDYKALWKQHVDRYSVELSIPGADRRVDIGGRKYWIETYEAFKRDTEKSLFAS